MQVEAVEDRLRVFVGVRRAGVGGEGLIAWIAQTFIQLVLLSIIMVGQNVQSLAADARSANTFKDAETILDRLDLHTQGGLRAILDRLDEIDPPKTAPAPASAGKPGGPSDARS